MPIQFPPARRRSSRIGVRIPIELVVNPQTGEKYKATTIDFSPLGARIRGSIAGLSADELEFVAVEQSGQSWPCRVIWMAGVDSLENREVGLEFLGNPLSIAA